MTNKKIAYYILIVGFVLSLFMHLNIFKTDLIGVHLWRQSQTQWNINNFVDQDFNILNPRTASFNQGKDNIYRYEFPVMQWLVACFIKIFGNNILVTRISMFLLGLFTCFGLFTLFRQVTQDYIISSLATFAFCFSPIFYYYTMNPLPDNMALCCATWYLVYIMKLKDNINWKNIFISAFFLLIATLSKLPYIIFGASLLVVLSKRDNFHVAFKTLLIYALILFPALLWYVWVIPGWNGNGIINGIINSPVTIGRGVDILIYHFHEMFPHHLMNTASTILFLFAVYFAFKEKLFRSYPFQILLASYIMCIFYFLFEFPMIEMIHDYYMMPFLPLLFAGVCFGLKKAWYLNLYIKWAIILLVLWMPFLTYNSTQNNWSVEKSYCNKDLFTYKNELRSAVPKSEQCIILNDESIFVFAYMVDKKGHIFKNDELQIDWVRDMISRFKIKYMYSDSRKIDEDPDFNQYVDSLLMQKGSIKVFKLKSTI